MIRRFAIAALLAAASVNGSALADEGMWLLSKPPIAAIKAAYGVDVTPQWLEHQQKSAVRFDTGGSGSLVSAEGLVMTNHHVGSDMISKLSTATKDLLKEGFTARTRAEDVLRRARTGQDFSALAREFSDEPGAASSGGSLGTFGRGAMVPPFERAAFALGIGQISDIVETPFGFHVIKRTQ